MPQNLIELETFSGEAAAKAIAAYHKAACTLREYNQDVIKVVEGAGATISGVVWHRCVLRYTYVIVRCFISVSIA